MQLEAVVDQAPPVVPDKRYYTDDDVCAMFEVSKRTTARWREEKLIGFLRVPGSKTIRYTPAQIREFEKYLEHSAKR